MTNMVKDKNNRIDWIDTAKVITMILVVLGHCKYYSIKTAYGGMDYVSNLDNHSALDQVLGWIVNFIYAFHMPLFFMLSGMCFYLSTKRKTILLPKLLKSKAIRLLLPFVFVSLLLSIPIKYCSGYWQGSDHIFMISSWDSYY